MHSESQHSPQASHFAWALGIDKVADDSDWSGNGWLRRKRGMKGRNLGENPAEKRFHSGNTAI